MLTIFTRAILLYVVLMLTMRAMGKRQLGQFQPYEFVMVMLIANLVSTPMSDIATPLLSGLLPVAALFVVHSLITQACMRSDRVRAVISGKPSLIVSKGVIQQDELRRLNLTLADLLEGVRACGILDPGEVCTAIMESNGTISAFPFSDKRPPQTGEMGLDPGYEGMPMILIMDGRVQKNNLSSAQLDEKWLEGQLSRRSLCPGDVFLGVLDTQGRLSVQDRQGNVVQLQAIAPGEVKW